MTADDNHGVVDERTGFRDALMRYLAAVDDGTLRLDDMTMKVDADIMQKPVVPGQKWVESAYTGTQRITFTMTVTHEATQTDFYADIAKRIAARQHQQQEAQG